MKRQKGDFDMTMQEIIQILGGIGVIASMVYVAIQIRNNGRATRAATFQQISSSMANDWLSMACNPEMVSVILRGSDDFDALNRVEKARMRFFIMGYARNFENAFFQHKIGTLRNKDWVGISADIHILFSMPGISKIWQLVKTRSSPEFQAYIDAIVKAAQDVAKPTVRPQRKLKRSNPLKLRNLKPFSFAAPHAQFIG